MRFSLFALVLILVGCESVRSVRVGGAFVPPRPSGCAIEVHSQAPAASHDVVCEIQAPLPYESSLDAIKERACECGADAVVLPTAQYGVPSRISGVKYRNKVAD